MLGDCYLISDLKVKERGSISVKANLSPMSHHPRCQLYACPLGRAFNVLEIRNHMQHLLNLFVICPILLEK